MPTHPPTSSTPATFRKVKAVFQMTAIVRDLLRTMNSGQTSALMLLDLLAAIDVRGHKILNLEGMGELHQSVFAHAPSADLTGILYIWESKGQFYMLNMTEDNYV